MAIDPIELTRQLARYTVDLYHVCDYFAAVWPEERESVRLHRDRLKAGALEEVLTALRAREEPGGRPDAEAPARAALRYLENRRDQLDYPAALAAGLPVGSGLIESGNRHVLQRRLKQAGAWLVAGKSRCHGLPSHHPRQRCLALPLTLSITPLRAWSFVLAA